MTDFELFLNNVELQKEIDNDSELRSLCTFAGDNLYSISTNESELLPSIEEVSSCFFNSMEGCSLDLVSNETKIKMSLLIEKHLGEKII